MSCTTDFLAKRNKNFREVIEAESSIELIYAMQVLHPAQMTQVAEMSRLVHKDYTEKVRKITGDFSSLVIRDTDGESDSEYIVVRYDALYDGGRGKWSKDNRFGYKGGVSTDTLDALWRAFEVLVDCPYDMYYENREEIKDCLEEEHAQAVVLSKLLGTDKALEMFSFCIEYVNGFKIVSTGGIFDGKFGVIVVKDHKDRRYRVGTRATSK
jgi:hypothetical protein